MFNTCVSAHSELTFDIENHCLVSDLVTLLDSHNEPTGNCSYTVHQHGTCFQSLCCYVSGMATAFSDAYVQSVLPGSECKVPAGVLTVSLELYPPLTETLTADIISTQVGTLDSLHPSVYLCLCLFIVNKDPL